MPHTLIYLFIHRDRIHGAASSLSEHIRLITPLTTDSCNHDLKSTCHASLFFWTAYRVASHLCPCAFPPSAPWKCTTLIMTNNSTLHACPFSRDCFQGGQSFVSEYIRPVSPLASQPSAYDKIIQVNSFTIDYRPDGQVAQFYRYGMMCGCACELV